MLWAAHEMINTPQRYFIFHRTSACWAGHSPQLALRTNGIPPVLLIEQRSRSHQGVRLGDDPPFLGGAHCESLNYGSYLTPHGMKGLIEPIYLGGTPPPCAARRGPRGCE